MKNQDELKKTLKLNTIIICILVVILLISIIVFIVNISLSGVRTQNNESNLGMVCEGDGYTFYYKYMSGIYKIKGDEEYKISDDQAYSLAYDNEYVYYTSPNNSGGIDIKKIKDNGDETVTLKSVSSSSTKMYLDNGYIYYITVDPDSISRIDLNGENEKSLISRVISDFDVAGENIYFVDDNDCLASIDINGENYSEINSNFSANKIQIYNKKLYYFVEDTGLMKSDLNNKKEEVVSDKVNSNIYNVTNKGIFFLNKDSLNICKISLNGKKYKELVSVKIDNTKIDVLKNSIYYLDVDDESEIYKTFRVNLNGKTVDKINY